MNQAKLNLLEEIRDNPAKCDSQSTSPWLKQTNYNDPSNLNPDKHIQFSNLQGCIDQAYSIHRP